MKRLKSGIIIFIAVLSLFMSGGCSGAANESSAHDTVMTSAADTQQTETVTAEAGLKRADYKIDYHIISPFLESYNDDKTVKLAHKVIDAFLSNETEIDTADINRRDIENVHSLVRYMCPPFAAFCEVGYDMDFEAVVNKITWKYRIPREELEKELERFQSAVDNCLKDVYEGDSDGMKALCIYYAFTKELEYDYNAYDVSDEDEYASFYRTSPFCAITDHTGICYNISEGLAFLFNTVGINAGSVGSYEGAGAHEWVIAQLDGKYYYFDATWETDNPEIDSLTYFGITEEDRAGWAGEYPADSVVFAAVRPIKGKYDISDTRFESIHGQVTACVKSIVPDHKNQIAHIETDSETIDFDMRK